MRFEEEAGGLLPREIGCLAVGGAPSGRRLTPGASYNFKGRTDELIFTKMVPNGKGGVWYQFVRADNPAAGLAFELSYKGILEMESYTRPKRKLQQ